MKNLALMQYTSFDTKVRFNQTLRHLVSVSSLIDSVQRGTNLADLLHDLVQQGHMERGQTLPIIAVVLREKLGAAYVSRNLNRDITEPARFEKIVETCKRWNAIDMVCVYYHPHIGAVVVNPANAAHWDILQELKQNELMIVYAHSKKNKIEAAQKAIEVFFRLLLEGKVPQHDPGFIMSLSTVRSASKSSVAPWAVPASKKPLSVEKPEGKIQLTPKYSIQVSNELFHNGNVEAWKNVIESYTHTHPQLRVIVYHDGELIHDLNALFKWGKVKHGGLIFFQVVGPQIKNVSRLQKYLTEGASPRFETFMKHDINKVLPLF